MRTNLSPTLSVIALGIASAAFAAYRQQGTFPGPGTTADGLKNLVTISEKDGVRTIQANGIPDHETGTFPNRSCPNGFTAQRYNFQVPVKPKDSDTHAVVRGDLLGIAVNGIPFDPGTAELWNNNREWAYEALSGAIAQYRNKLGADSSNAHVQPNGAYHYHGVPWGIVKKGDYTHRMTLVGYAADGYPMYGPFGYGKADDTKSEVRPLKPSYRLKSGERKEGPGGAYDGSFWQDFEFVKGSGDLDEFNGRFGVTPEYPSGTYYYVVTEAFPYIPRMLKGTPDASFKRRPLRGGPDGRPGGPGFPPPPGSGGRGGGE